MAKICIAIRLIVIVAIWRKISGQECTSQPCNCCVGGNSNCRSRNYYCQDGCKDGIWSQSCYHHCPGNCVTCYQDSRNKRYPCTRCTDIFKYGDYCTTSCSAGCVGGICNKDGSCTCIAGYSGDKCDVLCPDKCQTCISPTNCQTCTDGYYNGYINDSLTDYTNQCKHSCRHNCKVCNGYNSCTSCAESFYGKYCQNDCKSGDSGNQCHCPNNCETCYANGQCKSCFAGYENINKNCSECAQNKYGPDCQSECSDNCLNNGENSNCGKNGTCVKGCKDGYYGGKCDLRCDQNCKRFTCSRSNGKCSYGCQEGFRFSDSICVLAVFPVMMFSVVLGGAVVFVVVIAVVVVLLIKRRNNCSQCCCATTTDLTVPEDTTHVYLTAISSANDRVEVADNADDSSNDELGVHVYNNLDVEESTTGGYEVPIQHHYETIREDYEPLNQQENEQRNYNRRIAPEYENTKITN